MNAEGRPLQDLVEMLVGECGSGVGATVRTEGAVVEAAAGTTEIGGDVSVDTGHHFRIGSVSKLACALAVLRLVERGEVSLDGDVGDLGISVSVPSVRDLLQMTSGIPNYLPALVGSPPDLTQFTRSHDPRSLIRLALAGERRQVGVFDYSNTNYPILGLLLDASYGSWADAVNQLVLGPLGMTSAAVPTDMALPEPHPFGYVSFGPDEVPTECTQIHPSASGPSGSLVSTAADVLRLLEGFLDGSLLGADLTREARRSIPTGPGGSYGLGAVGVELADGRTAWGHSGGVPGFMAFAYRTTDGQAAVVLRNHYAEWSNISRWNAIADHVIGPRKIPN